MLKRFLNKLFVFTIILVFFIISTGSFKYYTLVIGVIVSAITTYLFESSIVKKTLRLYDVLKLLYLFKYIVYFVKAEIHAHLELVEIILFNKPIRPAIVAVPYHVESDYGVTLIALTVTNTPGTIVLNIDTNSKLMYIHWINASTFNPDEARLVITSGFEKLVEKIFG